MLSAEFVLTAAREHGVTLEQQPRVQNRHNRGFADCAKVMKGDEHVGDLVQYTGAFGDTEQRSYMLPDDRLYTAERLGSRSGFDLEWMLRRHATRTSSLRGPR